MMFPDFELDLHSMTVDESLARIDHFLSESYAADARWVRVIHGKGTGVLRLATRRHLAKHPLVKSYAPADHWSGGDGATMVELAD